MPKQSKEEKLANEIRAAAEKLNQKISEALDLGLKVQVTQRPPHYRVLKYLISVSITQEL